MKKKFISFLVLLMASLPIVNQVSASNQLLHIDETKVLPSSVSIQEYNNLIYSVSSDYMSVYLYDSSFNITTTLTANNYITPQSIIKDKNGNIYYGDADGVLYKYDGKITTTLQTQSTASIKGISYTRPLGDGNFVIFGTTYWSVIDVNTFTEKSIHYSENDLIVAEVYDMPNGTIYLNYPMNGIYRVIDNTGNVVSSGNVKGTISSNNTASASSDSLINFSSANVRILNLDATVRKQITLDKELSSPQYASLSLVGMPRRLDDGNLLIIGKESNGFTKESRNFAMVLDQELNILDKVEDIKTGASEYTKTYASQFKTATNRISLFYSNLKEYDVLSYGIQSNNSDSNNTDATINNGVITMNNTAIAFSSATLNSETVVKSNADTVIHLNDSRGSGSGWSVNLAISDFVSQSINDPSANGNGQFQLSFPASAVTYTSNNPVAISGQNIHNTYGPFASNGTLSNTSQALLNASPGYGMGVYELPVGFEITIPKTVTINGLTGTGSKYQVNDEVGIMAGTYTSTFTFTQSIGI